MSYKLLGQGTFGIVITPPLNIHKTKKLNYVSKIIKKKINKTNKESKKNNEFNISKKLSKIKNAEQHFCIIEEMNVIKYNDIPSSIKKKSANVSKFFEYKDEKEYISFLMPNCGVPITTKETLKFLKVKNNFQDFINHLLLSLKYLKQKKVVLGDIKLDNILIKNNKPILIDYGKSQIINKIYKNIHSLICSTGYYSPEMYLLESLVYDEDNEKVRSKITHKNIIDTIENDIVNDSYINEAAYDICNKEDTKTIERLKKYYTLYKNKSFGNNLLKNLKKEMIYKCDIYSLGRTLEYLYDLLKIKNEKILALIQNMTEFNHEKRFSIKQCIEFSN